MITIRAASKDDRTKQNKTEQNKQNIKTKSKKYTSDVIVTKR